MTFKLIYHVHFVISSSCIWSLPWCFSLGRECSNVLTWALLLAHAVTRPGRGRHESFAFGTVSGVLGLTSTVVTPLLFRCVNYIFYCNSPTLFSFISFQTSHCARRPYFNLLHHLWPPFQLSVCPRVFQDARWTGRMLRGWRKAAVLSSRCCTCSVSGENKTRTRTSS